MKPKPCAPQKNGLECMQALPEVLPQLSWAAAASLQHNRCVIAQVQAGMCNMLIMHHMLEPQQEEWASVIHLN